MKIAYIATGVLEIPPKNWGAIEKIIWNFSLFFKSLGNEVDIIDFSSNKLLNKYYDIVHVFIANQALELKKLDIPYFFHMCDHHTYIYGKNSPCYNQNLEAIQGSILTIFPAEFLLEYFNFQQNAIYIPIGVDNNLYNFKERNINDLKLLCVANNGTIANQFEDRKGFLPAIEAAKKLNLPITIAGPSNNNKTFFDHYNIKYDKLNLVFDLNENELIKLFQDHHIFLHLSSIETGHPNMTIVEALSTGLPVVGTYWGGNILEKGLIRVNINIDQTIDAINKIKNNYKEYNFGAREESLNFSWNIICNQIYNLYNSYINNFYKISKFDINSLAIYKNKLKYIYNSNFIKKQINNTNTDKDIINSNFVHSNAIINITQTNKNIFVKFINQDNDEILYQSTIKQGHYASSSLKYFINYKIQAYDADNGDLLYENIYNAENQRVLISFESSALGDTLAWFPAVVEFKNKHKCKLIVSTFHNKLFKSRYQEIEFIEPGETINDIYALYRIGIFEMEDRRIHINDPRLIPLQQVATDILGLKYKEIKPNIYTPNQNRPIEDKYICIGTESTAQAKLWNNPNGWQETIDYLNNKGYKVVSLSHTAQSNLKNVVHIFDKPLTEIIKYIYHSEFFIGLGSGLSWLAWALNKKVILISGFSKPFSEFTTEYRVTAPNNVCNGCFNDNRYLFTKEWDWCPVNKNTSKAFECTKMISSKNVIEQIDRII